MADIVGGNDLGTARGRRGTAWASNPRLEGLIAAGIDDLAKYRLVRLLYQYPAISGNAALFAGYLGSHSVAATTATLDELVASGLLAKREVRSGSSSPDYHLAGAEARRRLMRLYCASGRSPKGDEVTEFFAYLVLKKVRASAPTGRGVANAKQIAGSPLCRGATAR